MKQELSIEDGESLSGWVRELVQEIEEWDKRIEGRRKEALNQQSETLWSTPLVCGKEYDVTARYIGGKPVDKNGLTKVKFCKSDISMVAKEDSFRISGGEGKTLADVFDPKEVEIIKVEEVKR